MVDLGDVPAEPGDEVVLIGRQGDDEITAHRVGRAPRHHLLRDRLRHRRTGAADLPRRVATESTRLMEMQWRRDRMAGELQRNRPD